MNMRLLGLAGCLCLMVTQPAIAHEGEHGPPLIQHEISAGPTPWTGETPRYGARDFHFVVVSDNSGNPRPGIYREAMEKAELLQPAFVISIGDMIDGRTEEDDPSFEDIEAQWDEFMTYLAPLSSPFFFVPGNHDLGKDFRRQSWETRFGPSYYYFIYQDVLFLILDSTDYSPEQQAWLADALKRHGEVRWTYLFQHHPFWLTDNKQWAPVAKLLEGREKLTVFGGHIHNYAYTRADNIHYVTMATTGGGSQLRGRHFGEMDHLMWVTVTDKGPAMAAVELDGILPADYLAVEQLGAFAPFIQGTAVTAKPVSLDKDDPSHASWVVAILNPWDKPLRFNGLVEADNLQRVHPTSLDEIIAPGAKITLMIEARYDTPPPSEVFSTLRLHWRGDYDLFNAPPIAFNDVLRLNADGQHTSTRREDIVVDGSMAEWGPLRFDVQQPGQLIANEAAWKGAQDANFQFDVSHDDANIYVALAVADDQITGEGIGVLQDFGRALFRALGPMPEAATLSKASILSIVDGPELGGRERNRHERYRKLPNESADFGGNYAHTIQDGAISFEFSMPRASLEKAAGTSTEYVQVNVAYNDHDDTDARLGTSLLLWHPLWDGVGDAVSLGVFHLP